MDKFTVKGSQFEQPMFEFSVACSGCGETPYIKLATQLYGNRMIVANASGCTSVYLGLGWSSSLAKNEHGQGVTWARSLFEDNAEFGMGMFYSVTRRREDFKNNVINLIDRKDNVIDNDIKSEITNWIEHTEDSDKCNTTYLNLVDEIEKYKDTSKFYTYLNDNKTLFSKPSYWILGGDGWAYDIGFGGLDHVLSQGNNVNILILDTEM